MEIIFGLASALCFGCADFCARFSTRAIGTYRTLFYVQAIGFLGLSLYLLLTGELFTLGSLAGWQVWAWGILASCIEILSYVALYRAFAVGKLAVVAPIAASYAAITVLLSLLTGEQLSWLQGLGIVAILVGVALAASGHSAEASDAEVAPTLRRTALALPPGVGWALLAAVGLGLTFWLLGFFLTPALGQIVPIWLFRLVGFLLLIPLALFSRERLSLPSGSSVGLVLGIGLLDTGAFVASALGFTHGNIAIVSVLVSLYSAVAVLLAALFLRERLHALQWLGIGVLLVGVMLTHV